MRHHMTVDGAIPFTAQEETARDAEEKKWADGKTVREAVKAIQRLESAITSRRYRDAIAGTDGGWLANQEKLIAVERGKL